MWKKQLKSLNNRESYISITIGFITVVSLGTVAYNYFSNKASKSSVLGKSINQTPTEQKPSTNQETYVVAKGDDLWKIAVKMYGDGFAWVKIAKANNLSNPSDIHQDNRLIIPR